MNYVLKGLALLAILYAFVKGIAQADGWGTIIAWWARGVVSGIVLYSLGLILDYLEHISARLHHLEHELLVKSAPASPPKLGNSKADLSRLKDFKI